MGNALSIIIVTEDKQAAAHVAALAQGTNVRLMGVVGLSKASLAHIAQMKPCVVIVGGQGRTAEYLSFARTLMAADPAARCVFLGANSDVTVIARAVAAGVQGYLLPETACRTFLRAIVAAAKGEIPAREDAFARVARAMAIPGGRPKPNVPPRALTPPMRKALSQCLRLGLTVAETASYMGLSGDQVTGCVGLMRVVGDVTDCLEIRRLAVLIFGVLGCFWSYQTAADLMASSGMRTVALQGQLRYEDGEVVPVGACELTFYPTRGGSRARKLIGRAITDPATGEFTRVCSDGKFAGLLPGEYRVTIRLPGQVPLPSYLVADDYADDARTPLKVDVGKERFQATLRRPQAMMDQFDRDKDGIFSAPERHAVVAAVRNETARRRSGD